MGKHAKLAFVEKIRERTDRAFIQLPLPRIHPNKISGLSVITSIAFLLTLSYSLAISFAFLVISVLLDWLDGLTAKKYGMCSDEGYMVDVASDRLSEAIIFAPFLFPWFLLFTLNCILTMFSFERKTHVIMPLRQIFILYFLWMFLL